MNYEECKDLLDTAIDSLIALTQKGIYVEISSTGNDKVIFIWHRGEKIAYDEFVIRQKKARSSSLTHLKLLLLVTKYLYEHNCRLKINTLYSSIIVFCPVSLLQEIPGIITFDAVMGNKYQTQWQNKSLPIHSDFECTAHSLAEDQHIVYPLDYPNTVSKG